LAASDPWGQNSVATESTSRITIVRVPSQPLGAGDGDGAAVARRSSWGSNHSHSSSSGSTGARPASPGHRMSFALSSFTPIVPTADRNSPRPSSPSQPTGSHFQRNYANHSLSRSTAQPLSPQQLYDIAKTCSTPPQSLPSHSRPNTPGGAQNQSPALLPDVFTPLPDDYDLPFLHRPEEVSELISTPPTSRLFSLLGALFPKSSRPPSVTATSSDTGDDPKSWSFARLTTHLTTVTREEMDDRTWVSLARTCVRNRSEPLWERFKGALGVPWDLDAEEGEEPFQNDNPRDIDGGYGDVAVDDEEYDPDEEAYIEPVFANSPNPASLLHPGSPHRQTLSPLPQENETFGFGGREGGMENIGEEKEETSKSSSLTPEEEEEEKQPEEPPALPPPEDLQIHALRIHAPSFSTQAGAGSPIGTSPLSPRRGSASSQRYSALGGLGLSTAGQPASERGPGNPLFPSSFAGLSIGPTLSAK
jgi:hypothetical protein